MKLSIIIVNYNTYYLTKQTIDSVLEKHLNFDYEIMLVDNDSQDGSIQMLEEDYTEQIANGRIKCFKNQENLGFSKANNIGMRAAVGAYILLLNSDTYVVEDALEKSIQYMDTHKQVGTLGCKVVLADGTLDHACKRGFPTPQASLYYLLGMDKRNPKKYGQYDALHIGEDETSEIDCLMGAFMLMPKAVLDEVGLLDENFFMYGEDIDLCYRIKAAGYQNIYYPEAKIIHYKGGSSKRRRKKIIFDFHDAMWRFYKKHYYKKYGKVISGIVYVGIRTKYGLALLKNSFQPKEVPLRGKEETQNISA